MRRRKRVDALVPRADLANALEYMKKETDEFLRWEDNKLSYLFAIYWKGYTSREKQILEKVKEIFYPRPEIKFLIRTEQLLPYMVNFMKGYRGRIILSHSKGIILRKTNETICKIYDSSYRDCRGFLSVNERIDEQTEEKVEGFYVTIRLAGRGVVLHVLYLDHIIASLAITLNEGIVKITNPESFTLSFLRLGGVEQKGLYDEELKYREPENKEEKQLSLLVHERLKLFVVVLVGLGGDGVWSDFLKKGLYDPRILLFIHSFLIDPYRLLKHAI